MTEGFGVRRKRPAATADPSQSKRRRSSSPEVAICCIATQVGDRDLRLPASSALTRDVVWSAGMTMEDLLGSLGQRRGLMDSDSTVRLLRDVDEEPEPTLVLDFENVRVRARLRRPGELRLVLETLQAILNEHVSIRF